MANVDSPFGLSPIGHKWGANYRVVSRPYYVPSSYGTAIFVGDPVLKTGTANTSVLYPGAETWQAGVLPEVNVSAAGGNVSGVMVGKRFNSSNYSQIYNPASTEAVIFVMDDPGVIYRVKEDSVGGALAATSVGLNADIALDVAGSTVTGISGAELDSSSAAAAAGTQLKILRLSDFTEPNGNINAIGSDAKWDVTINEHTEADNIAGV